MPIDPESPLVLVPYARLQMDRITGNAILLYPEGALELDETAEAILRHLDGSHTLAEIAGRLASAYEGDAETIRRDVEALIAQLDARGLIVG